MSDFNMTERLSASPISSSTTMGSTPPSLHNVITQRMNQASGYTTTEAQAEYWPPDLYISHNPGASTHGQNQILEPDASDAETWAPTTTSAHSSYAFMNAGIPELTRLLNVRAAIEAHQGTTASVNTAGPSNPTANATVATPGRRNMWEFCERSFRLLLQKYIARREEHLASRYTIKKYMEEDMKWAAKVRALEAHIRALEARVWDQEATIWDQEATMGKLSDECQAYREEVTALQNKSRMDAQKLRRRYHLISRLYDRFVRRTHSFAQRN